MINLAILYELALATTQQDGSNEAGGLGRSQHRLTKSCPTLQYESLTFT